MTRIAEQHGATINAVLADGSDFHRIDEVDRAILRELVRNARISFRDLGATVGLSANAAAERVRKLRRAGVITAFTTLVDPAAGGDSITALVDVRLAAGQEGEAFERAVTTQPAVTEAVHVTGRFDYQLRVRCRDATELDRTLRWLKANGTGESETRLVLSTAVQRR